MAVHGVYADAYRIEGDADEFNIAIAAVPVPVFCTVRNRTSALLAPTTVAAFGGLLLLAIALVIVVVFSPDPSMSVYGCITKGEVTVYTPGMIFRRQGFADDGIPHHEAMPPIAVTGSV